MYLVNKTKQIEHDNPVEDLVIQYKISTGEQKEIIKYELINKLLYLVKRISRRYIHMYHAMRYYEDIISEGTVGFIRGIDNAYSQLKDNNIIGFVNASIHTQIINYLRKEFQVYHKKVLRRIYKNIEVNNNDIRLIELKELLYKVIKRDIEKRFVQLKEEGYKDKEIAEILHVTHSNVGIIRRQIRNKINKILEFRRKV